MVNILCVKWGDKFDSEFVNRLYTMVQRNFSKPFTFYCYTDNKVNINPQVNIIPIEEEFDVWWNKLSMFKKGFVPHGPCIYFDLDVVLQSNVEWILDHITEDKLTMIECIWKNVKPDEVGDQHWNPSKRFNTNLNSSVLTWYSDSLNHIWEHFYKDPEWYMLNYHGIDRFIPHEGFEVNTFPPGKIYSRLYGIDEEQRGPIVIQEKDLINVHRLFEEPTYSICIFNGYSKESNKFKGVHLDDDSYKGYEKYWS